MKVEYFFPVFKEDDIKQILTNFKNSKCFKENKDYGFTFVCEKEDKKNLEFLTAEALRNQEFKIIVLDKPFTFNDAFHKAVSTFKADVVLLGDTKVARIDLVFEKCLEKFNNGANIVQITKRISGFKGFFKNLRNKIYNFFVRIFTNKKDRLNVVSLGLIDKNIIDLLAVLPNNCCFLKNTKSFKGFESRTIYIDANTKTYKESYKKMTPSLRTSISSYGITVGLIALQILLNCLIKNSLIVYNIISCVVIFLGIIMGTIFLQKHFFEIRNFETNTKFNIEKINFEKKEVKEEKEDKKPKKDKEAKEQVKPKKATKKTASKTTKTVTKTKTASKTKSKPKKTVKKEIK